MERIVKFRLVTYFNEVDSPVDGNVKVLTEKIAHQGEKVDIERKQDLDRLDGLGAIFSEAETAAVEDGTYNGVDAAVIYNARAGIRPKSPIQAASGEGSGDIDTMDATELGEFIAENRLNVQATLALLPEDADEEQINKLYDAENIATDNDPRKGVTDTLDAKLAAAVQK